VGRFLYGVSVECVESMCAVFYDLHSLDFDSFASIPRYLYDVLMVVVRRSPIMSETAVSPDKIVLKLGIFPRIPTPEAESFAEHRHVWQGTHEGLVQFATVRGGRKLGE
jgi:hypothetical protein